MDTPPPNTPGTYCSFRNKRTCVGPPIVDTLTKFRIRRGKLEVVTYYLCEFHAKTVTRSRA